LFRISLRLRGRGQGVLGGLQLALEHEQGPDDALETQQVVPVSSYFDFVHYFLFSSIIELRDDLVKLEAKLKTELVKLSLSVGLAQSLEQEVPLDTNSWHYW